jgi:Family of unknown function (DUF5683)
MIPSRRIGFLLLLGCLLTCPAVAQTPDSASVLRVLQPLLDSLPKTVTVGSSTLTRVDSVGRKVLDTLRVSRRAQAAMRLIVPKTATYRSLMFPGLGQIYNHDYWKLPFVYGGFVVLGYYINTFTQSLNLFTAGYTEAYYSTTKTAIVGDRVYGLEQIKSVTDKYRSWRDGDIILAVGLYALTAVEANVAAHLKTFDLSESLTMTIKPAVLPLGGLVPAPGVRIALTFK